MVFYRIPPFSYIGKLAFIGKIGMLISTHFTLNFTHRFFLGDAKHTHLSIFEGEKGMKTDE
jgi:hypothetical protein